MSDVPSPDPFRHDPTFEEDLSKPPPLPLDDALDADYQRSERFEDPDERDFYPFEELVARPVPPHPGYWWAKLWCVGYIVATQIPAAVITFFFLIILLSGKGEGLEKLDDPDIYSTPEFARAMGPGILGAQIIGIAGSWLAIRLVVGRHWPRILALRLPGGGQLLIALLALPGMIAIAAAVDTVMARLLLRTIGRESFFGFEEMVGVVRHLPLYFALLAIAVGPGLAEELFFRGFLGRGLVGRYGAIGGVLLTSMFFAIMHLEPRQVAYTFFMGIALHAAYLLTRSLWVPVLLHIANNGLSVLMMKYAGVGDPIESALVNAPWYALLLLGICGVLSLLGVFWALYQSRGRLESQVEGLPAWAPSYPGVACPPPRTETIEVRRWPSFAAWIAALCGLLAFVGGFLLILVIP